MKVKTKEQIQIAEVLSEMGMSDEVVEVITQVKHTQMDDKGKDQK